MVIEFGLGVNRLGRCIFKNRENNRPMLKGSGWNTSLVLNCAKLQ